MRQFPRNYYASKNNVNDRFYLHTGYNQIPPFEESANAQVAAQPPIQSSPGHSLDSDVYLRGRIRPDPIYLASASVARPVISPRIGKVA